MRVSRADRGLYQVDFEALTANLYGQRRRRMSADEQHLYFSEDFKLGPNYRTTYKTTLRKDCIVYEAKSSSFVNKILLNDVTGVKVSHITRSKAERFVNENSVFIHIYSYPLKKKRFSKSLSRHRKEHVFCVGNGKDFNENKALAERWTNSIKWLLTTCDVDYEKDVPEDFPPRQQFLVFINPFGGKGRALKLFNKEVKPMLEEADVHYEVKVTVYSGHAKEIAQNMDVGKLDGILFCSGDGLIYEVVNGLMSRPDWQSAIKVPIGHIPCGSGNGLCSTVLHHSGEPCDITSSVFSILRGVPVPLDIVKLQTANSEVHYSTLGVTLGFVADVDIESEQYRYLGDIRFSYMGLKRIMNRRYFTGKVWYLPLEGEQLAANSHDEQNTESQQSCDDNQVPVSVSKQPLEYGACGNGIPNVHLPSIEDSISTSWKSIEGSFIGWAFVTLSHISKDCYLIPDAQLGDGVIYGSYLAGDMSRKNLWDVFDSVSKGEHMSIEGMHIIKARAFRFEPYVTSSKNITIDGEKVHYGTVQGEVYKGLGRVICHIPKV